MFVRYKEFHKEKWVLLSDYAKLSNKFSLLMENCFSHGEICKVCVRATSHSELCWLGNAIKKINEIEESVNNT